MNVFIYCLLDENEIPFYVGKTKNPLKTRESQHQRRMQKNLSILELDIVDECDWKFWECYWIEQFKYWGICLSNKNVGGGGPSFHSESTKTKMKNTPHPGTSNKLKNVKRPDVSNRLKNTKLSDETCQKISKAKKNHPCYSSLERGEKISKSNTEHYLKNSARNSKISIQLKGRKNPWIEQNLGKPIVQLDKNLNLIKEWESASKAAKSLNKQSPAISECCSKKRKTAYGYVWLFREEYIHLNKNQHGKLE
jgi:hypothetical protein